MPRPNPDERILSTAIVPPEAAQLCMIGDILVDAVVHESHEAEATITTYPVEKGSDLTDNIRNEPRTITLECVVSNTPISSAVIANRSGVNSNDNTGNAKASDDVYLRLLAIREAREPVDVQTSLESYKSMGLQSLSIPRSSAQGDCLWFTAKFVEVEVVENVRMTRVAIPAAKGNATPKTIAGSLGNKMKGTVYIAVLSREWFDDNILAWRQRAYSNKDAGITNVSNAPAGSNFTQTPLPADSWQVVEDKPDFTSQAIWDTNTVDQNTQNTQTLGELAKKNNKPYAPSLDVQVDMVNGTIIAVPGGKVFNRGRI